MTDTHKVPEALRSKPDLLVYVPEEGRYPEVRLRLDATYDWVPDQEESSRTVVSQRDFVNQHFLVTPTPNDTFLALWTQASLENAPDQRVVVSRSLDRGKTWTDSFELDGQENGNGQRASWGFPFVVPHTGRIYVFYNKNIGRTDIREDTTGVLRFRYSDDDGLTWSRCYTLPMRRTVLDHPDPDVPPNWIVFQIPIITNHGEVMAGFTRWASRAVQDETVIFKVDSEIWFLRFDNLLTETEPENLTVTTLPDSEHGIRVPNPEKPSVSVAQEPTLHSLSDGRLITIMRTLTGYIYYSLSSDGGRSWGSAQPLRFVDGGPKIPQPISPCPLYKLRDGRFVLIFHNNDGTANDGKGPTDAARNRTPVYTSIGREVPYNKGQPIIFGKPKLLAANDLVPAGPFRTTQIGTYPSLFECGGRVYFFYPDRKHFLLGKILKPELLDDWGLPY